MKHAYQICLKMLGSNHPDTIGSWNGLIEIEERLKKIISHR